MASVGYKYIYIYIYAHTHTHAHTRTHTHIHTHTHTHTHINRMMITIKSSYTISIQMIATTRPSYYPLSEPTMWVMIR